MKNDLVKIVMLEDNPSDADLISRLLKKSTLNYQLEIAENKEDFNTLLFNFKPHIVLSDYKLPAFDGLEALSITRQVCGDIPFILISGTIGEEKAVEAMKMGVHDYIMKDKLARLIPTIERELDEAHVRELQLKEHRELALYKKIFTNSKDAIAIISKEGYYIEQNEAHKNLLGYEMNELANKKPSIHIEDKQFKEIFKEVNEHGLFRGVSDSVSKDGKKLFIDVTYFPVNNSSDNNHSYFIGIMRDITAQKNVEQQLKKSEEKFREIIESSPIAIFLINPDGKIRFSNSSACELIGYSEIELINLSINDIISKSFIDKGIKHLDKVKSKGREFNLEIILKHKNNSYTHVILDTVKLSADEYLVFCKDITKIKKNQKELIKAKEKAEESDLLKTIFLANMSHEIRTPMNGIIGFTKLLKTQSLTEEKRNHFIDIIESSSNHLLNIINDIIEISIIEANQLKIINNNFFLNCLLDDLYAFFKNSPPGNKTHIELIYKKYLSNENSMICSDEARIRQILYNLLCNAYKFTHKGTIEFGYILVNNKIQFYVKDTGVGIPTKAQKIIFERFRQADDSHTRVFGGTGLGLSICKGLVNKMNGQIWLESIEKVGTAFYFTLPFDPVKKLYANNLKNFNIASQNWKGKTILIAEDHELNYFFLEELLVNSGASLIWKKNGADTVKECIQNKNIDLILMDIRMPKMNGIIAAQKIRKFNQEIPIIAQTAYAFCEDREKCVQAGCNEYITKPINNMELYSIISSYLN